MTQNERWLAKYNEVKNFILGNKRNPSKDAPEERNMYNYIKHTRKQINQGLLKPERLEEFMLLQELMEQYKRVNQYV